MMRPSYRCSSIFRAVTVTRLLPTAIWSILVSNQLAGQMTSTPPLTVKDGLTLGSAALVWAIPNTLGWHNGLPSCAPCDPDDVPFFDRWAIHPPEAVVSQVSTVALAGLVLAGWFDLAGEGRRGRAAIVASIESMAWAQTITHLAKGAIGRTTGLVHGDCSGRG